MFLNTQRNNPCQSTIIYRDIHCEEKKIAYGDTLSFRTESFFLIVYLLFMSTALVVGILLLLVLIGFVLYIGFYNRNMPFCVNLFGFFSWALLNTVLTE